ncbi:MAG: putative motility protein [Methylococcales bacterium]
MDSISGIANAAIAMQQQKMAQQVNLAVINKAQDVQKQQGEAVLQLLNSTPGSSTKLDVYA